MNKDMNVISSMPEQQIKELLSKDYLGVIASRAGFKKEQPTIDNGVDLSFTYPSSYLQSGNRRICDTGDSLQFQIKATTEKGITADGKGFYYDLKVKNYNDLIFRRDKSHIPLILVVFILPFDTKKWISLDIDFLVMRKNAFWYYPDKNQTMSTNSSTIRIFVPYANRIDSDFFERIMQNFYRWFGECL